MVAHWLVYVLESSRKGGMNLTSDFIGGLQFHIRRVAVPTNKEERVSDACESVSRRVPE